MSFTITIAGTPIDMPNTSESPNWAPALVQFFKAVENAFTSVIGPYDVPPQVMDIAGDAFNPAATPLNINNLSFSSLVIRAAFISYAVSRAATGPITDYEAGNIIVLYNGSNWDISVDKIGDAKITFSIDATGQIQFTTATIGTTPHTGKISFKATALLNS